MTSRPMFGLLAACTSCQGSAACTSRSIASSRTPWAAQGGVERRDPAQHGHDVIGRWRARRSTGKLGDLIKIEVEIENRGSRSVTIVFSPLGSLFAFTVGGVSAQAPLFTVPLGIRTLPPGAAFTLVADLRPFATLERAGTYEVACTLNLEAIVSATYPARP